MTSIDRKLNLVIPLPRADGTTIHVHTMPITGQTFDQHFEIIAKVNSALFSEGYGAVSGPRIAAKLLKKIADLSGVWSGPMGVEATLMSEIRRLTGVIMPPGTVPSMFLLDQAVAKKIITPQELDIVENAIVFFIVISAMQRPDALDEWLAAMAGMWNAQITSLDSTGFARSLPTSTETDNSGETSTAA